MSDIWTATTFRYVEDGYWIGAGDALRNITFLVREGHPLDEALSMLWNCLNQPRPVVKVDD